MYESQPGSSSECANCGARLPAADGAGTRTCTFCHALYTPEVRPDPTADPVAFNITFTRPTVPTDLGALPSGKQKTGCGPIGALVLVIILVGSGIGLASWVSANGGFENLGATLSGGSHGYSFGSNAVTLAGEPTATPSIIVTSRSNDNGRQVDRLIRFDNGSPNARWISPPLPELASTIPILTDTTTAFVAVKNRVAAYKLSDGTQLWQGSLSDEFNTNSCEDCFTLVGNRLVARSADGTLQAFDTATGAPAWSRPLQDTNAKIVRVAGVVVVADGVGGDYSVTSIDAATGADVAKLAPTCPRPDISYSSAFDSSSIIRRSPAGDSLIVALGNSPWCIQGWDPHAGTMTWSVYADPTTYFQNDKFRLLDSPAGMLVGSSESIGIIAPDYSAYRPILRADQTEFLPLAATADTLYVGYVNSRGSTKSGIRALDVNSGEQRWEFTTGKAHPIDSQRGVFASYSTSNDGTFSATVDGTRVYVVTFVEGSSSSHTVAVDSIDATTGAAGPRQTMDSGSGSLIPDFGPVTWIGSRAVARVGDDTIQVIDAAAGKSVATMR